MTSMNLVKSATYQWTFKTLHHDFNIFWTLYISARAQVTGCHHYW